MHDREKTMISTLSAFAIGGLIGAGVALLVAPRSGEETRHMIRGKTYELKDRAVETVEDTKARTEQAIDDITSKAKERTEELKQRGQEMVEERRGRL